MYANQKRCYKNPNPTRKLHRKTRENLEIFGMTDAKTALTPALEKGPISSVDCPSKGSKEEKEMKCCNYKGLIGSLNYLANTWPDITFVVRSLNRFVQTPGLQHWNQAKHVLRYLKATKNRKLIYEKADQMRTIGYSEADWVGKIDSRKSTSGYCFFSKREFRCN